MAAVLAMPGGAPATPPTPVITATQSGPLTVKLNSSTGTHWSWTFLNAASAVVGTSTLQSPLQAFPQPGDYTAIVDATDDDPMATAPARAQTTFHVYNTPAASFTYTVLAGGTVQFTDTSTGEPTSWQWTFPGGTFTGRTPPAQVIPPRTPPWAVTLTVANPAGSSVVSVPVVVNGPPVAALTITPNPVGTNTTVTLNASGSTDPNGDALRYSWDLNGDKTYGDATGAIQTRTFTSPGTFRVGVRVSDPGGSSSDAVDFVSVLQDKPPVVNLSASPSTPTVGAPVTFTATASDPDGTVASIDWDIDGDGQFDDGTGAVVTKSFSTPGSRVVSVRATDNAGVATIAFRTIEVSASSQGQSGPATAAGGTPTSSASSAKLAMLTPFPVVRIRGVILRGSARLSLLSVKAPTGARVKVICHGGGCPKKKSIVLRVTSGKRSVRVRSLERRLRPGAVIEVFVTAPGRIGKYTRFTIRSNAAPARSDLCLRPGKSKPVACS
ncbi:MAG: PKD domain-containing protein [Actinomycetota bacterium]